MAQSAWKPPPSPNDLKTTGATEAQASEEEETIELAEINFVSNADGYGKGSGYHPLRRRALRLAGATRLGVGRAAADG